MECKEAIILKESHELREQNELLEFRIIELEEGADKVSKLLVFIFFTSFSIFRLQSELLLRKFLTELEPFNLRRNQLEKRFDFIF